MSLTLHCGKLPPDNIDYILTHKKMVSNHNLKEIVQASS